MMRPLVVTLVLLAALGAPACGGDDGTADRFREGYNQAVQRLNEVNSNIQESGAELAARPGDEIAREFERIATSADRTRDDLAELEPPDEAREEFDALLAAIGDGVSDIRAAADAARSGNQDRFAAAAERLSRSGQEIGLAEQKLKNAVESD